MEFTMADMQALDEMVAIHEMPSIGNSLVHDDLCLNDHMPISLEIILPPLET